MALAKISKVSRLFTLAWFGKFWFLCRGFPCFRLDGRKKSRKFFSSFLTFRFICAVSDHSNLEKKLFLKNVFFLFCFPTIFQTFQTLKRFLEIMAARHSGYLLIFTTSTVITRKTRN